MHSDDLYASSSVVEEIMKEFESDASLDGVYGDLIYTPKHDTSKVLRYWKSKDFDSSLLKQGWMPAHPTLILKKEVYEKYGNFDLGFKIAGDYEFMLRVLSTGIKVKYIPQVLYKMRVGGVFTLLIKNFSKIGQFLKKSSD